jgi:hypothetical protein
VERYHICSDAAVYFATYSVVDWLPVFLSETTCRIITESLAFCYGRKNLCINAYVIMPTHLHMIVFDREWDADRLQKTLTDFRKFTGRSLCDFFETRKPKCFAESFREAFAEDRERRFSQSAVTLRRSNQRGFGNRS